MTEQKGITWVKTEEKEECIKEAVITDQFKKMMNKTLEATRKVLKRRFDHLEEWGNKEQKEFYTIFGLSGDSIITTDYYVAGQNIEDAPLQREIKAYDFMKDSINKLIFICNEINVGERICESHNDFYRYGNFVNETALEVKASARVAKGQTLNKLPDEYKKILRIEILQNFKGRKLTGEFSQVATLCHELSHLIVYRVGDKYHGGMGTDDLPSGKFSPSTPFLAHARNLVLKHDPNVFRNAYNVEKYFQIQPD